MLHALILVASLAAHSAAPASKTQAAPAPAGPPATQLARRNCTINYYHYRILGLQLTGGYSLNLPLSVFVESDVQSQGQDQTQELSVFQMPLLPDVNIGYESRGKAFFISWLKMFRRPRLQFYFKLAI
ncbi:MAG TPA: hypothetical protein VMF29_02640 [Candidatus Edwardsbacteria bacterium]|nr:hypothetical protein [Candidatus Edwardsbacteria bacterium]